MLPKGATLLFQGDSITDTERNRKVEEPSRRLGPGSGYVQIIAGQLLADQPLDDLKIYNRGVSGNRIVDLYARWKEAALNLGPDMGRAPV